MYLRASMEGVICDVLTGATSSPSTRASNSVNGKMHACLGNCWTRSHTTSTLQRSRCAHLLSGVGLLACMERCPGLYRLSTEAPSSGGSRVEHSFTSSSRAPRLPGTLPSSEGAAVDGGALECWPANRRATMCDVQGGVTRARRSGVGRASWPLQALRCGQALEQRRYCWRDGAQREEESKSSTAPGIPRRSLSPVLIRPKQA